VCNRLLPPEATGDYLQEWRSIQQEYRQTVEESFSPLPILDVPLFRGEVVGPDKLRHMGAVLYGDRDPTDVFYTSEEQYIVENGNGYTLRVPLPVPSGKIQLNRLSSDELIVHIGNRKRILSLPHTLAVMKIRGARHQDNVLHIEFAPERSGW
jgi:arsenite-transporting ATPase